jgi:Phage P22-like portal protein/LAGLIDADG-like domain
MTDDDLLKEARDRLAACIKHSADDRREAAEDFRFIAGEQWPADMRQLRQVEARPCLTINKLPAFVHQVLNDQRMNRPSIKVHPVDDDADVEVAEVEQGMIRYIEYNSNADVAYDTSVGHATIGGAGYFRLVTDYTEEDSFDQEIKFRRVQNPFSVYVDPFSQEPDGSDMMYCFITELVSKAEFKTQYPDALATGADSLTVGSGDASVVWMSDDSVRVAEYYKVVNEPAKLVRLEDGRDIYETDMQEGDVVLVGPDGRPKSRDSFKRSVHWYKITGADVLETTEIPCKWIPVFPVYGDEQIVDGKIRRNGMVRFARDPQRMYNFWMHQSLDTPVVTPGGWSTIGALKIGDQVFSDTGEVSNVIGKSPVYIGKDCYRVTFGDGSSVVSSAEHPWVVEERGKRTSSGFKWVSRKLRTDELDPAQHCIKSAGPLQMPAADLPLEPYALGVWLGDGSRGSGAVSSSVEDIEPMRQELIARGLNVGEARGLDRSPCFSIYGICGALRELGVFNDKRIPAAYMRASADQRLELLRGLMDTDGTVHHASGSCMFTQADEAMAEQVRELIVSLGMRVGVTRREARVSMLANGHQINGTGSTQLAFMPVDGVRVFGLPRKAATQTRERKRHPRRAQHKIVSVERIDSVPVQCIGIDAPSHLYLCGKAMIPTHNTSATEEVSLRPKAPFIGAVGQFDTSKKEWKQANTRSFPFLEYDPITVDGVMAPSPQRQQMADVPSGVLAMAMHASDNIKATTGIFDASLGAQGNETSGRAITARQREGDTANFHFSDNLARTIRHAGRCILWMIPKVYDTERIVRVLGADEKMDMVPVNTPNHQQKPNQAGAIKSVLNDLTTGRYDVTIGVGPSYTTKRAEAVDAMMAVGQSWPQIWQIAGDKMIRAMDWPDADEIADRVAKTLPPELQDKDPNAPEEQRQLPPQVQQALQQAAQEIQQLQQALQEAQSGMAVKQLEVDSRERIAAAAEETKRYVSDSSNDVRHDIAELAGMVQLLAKQIQPPADLSSEVSADLSGTSGEVSAHFDGSQPTSGEAG